MQDLLETQRLDREHRHPGVQDGLFEFHEIQRGKQWDFSLPTLELEERFIKLPNFDLPRDLAAFKERWSNKYPFLEGFNWNNLVIAGGCIQKVLSIADDKDDEQLIDIDIFFYDLTPEQAENRIREIAKMLDQKVVSYLRSEMALTMIISDKKKIYGDYYMSCPYHLQFIFRVYSSISEVLHGFDLPSSAVGFDGEKLYFTANSKFAYEYRMNYVDTTRRSTTYEWRLNKYLYRGFGIIFPNLKYLAPKTKIGVQWVIRLPFLEIEVIPCNRCNRYEEGCTCTYLKNKNHLTGWIRKKVNEVGEPERWDPHLYYWNANNSDYWDVVINQEGPMGCHFLSMMMSQNLRWLLKFSKNREGGMYRKVMIINPDLEGALSNEIGMEEYIKEKFIMTKRKIPREIDSSMTNEMIKRLQEVALTNLQIFNQINQKKVNWITEQPGRQLTAAFNPIFEDPIEWYGEDHYV